MVQDELLNDLLLSYLLLGVGSSVFCILLAFVAQQVVGKTGASWGLGPKLLHVGIFSGAVPAQLWLGFWGVCLYGTVIVACVFLGQLRGESVLVSSVLGREGAESRKVNRLLVPVAATAAGGLSAALMVGSFAAVGYLVCGWGDGSGKVVGRLIGRRHYCSPFSRASGSEKTLEGSIAVLVGGFLGGWAALGLLEFPPLPAAGAGLAAGLAGALAEGLSGRRTENFWVQLIPSLTAWWILG
jgi:phytol kinase